MSTLTIRLNEELIHQAEIKGQSEHRKPAQQIEYWVKVARCAIDNPELSFLEIRDMFEGLSEANAGEMTEYNFG